MKFIPCLIAFLLLVGSELSAEVKALALKDKTLTVKIILDERCVFGDLDAIKYEFQERVEKKQKAKVIVTLEALNEDKVITKTLLDSTNPNDSSAIFKFDLSKLPKGPLALFICSDSEGKNYCADKNAAKFTEVFSRYQFKNDPKTGKPTSTNSDYLDPNLFPSDKIYFTSILNLNKSIEYYNPLLVNDLPALVKNISNAKKATSLKDLVQGLGSLPLSVAENHFIIKLPAYSPGKCNN